MACAFLGTGLNYVQVKVPAEQDPRKGHAVQGITKTQMSSLRRYAAGGRTTFEILDG